MLQQTRVATVVPYFESFLSRFPTVACLAEADLDEMLGYWSGLGYYQRARSLHKASREVVRRFDGTIPSSLSELRSLPGVGDYTAAAIASLAYGSPAATIDGNVRRVVARLLALRKNDSEAEETIQQAASLMLAKRSPGVFNEALMELGALLCTPGSPRCEQCPVAGWCEARRLGIEGTIPARAQRTQARTSHLVALLVSAGSKRLLGRRNPEGLFGRLWDVPTFERRGRSWRAWLAEVCDPTPPSKILRACCTLRHVLTHRVLEVAVIEVTVSRACAANQMAIPEGYDALRWVPVEERERLGMSRLAQRILALKTQPSVRAKSGETRST